MDVIHISAECYPAAKVGGLADVAGALPRYLREEGVRASVLIPGYSTEWIDARRESAEEVFRGEVRGVPFRINRISEGVNCPLHICDLPGLFDRTGIYTDPDGRPWGDEAERFITFQQAALTWIRDRQPETDLVHCHDHHTALIPFMMTRCSSFEPLRHIPTVLTVHNAQYQGTYPWGAATLLPPFPPSESGLLEWNGQMNCLAAGMKCCWHFTAVSPSYLEELREGESGLQGLFEQESGKATGILNGIDTGEWDPERDPEIERNFSAKTAEEGKAANRSALCRAVGLSDGPPLVSFIGRLVGEKGADLLPDLIGAFRNRPEEVNFLVLGTGDRELHRKFEELSSDMENMAAVLAYDEALARQIYAGSDFLVMPSRVEPCGLNQLYAMRYGTVPVVRRTGGLKDTVTDFSLPGGCGITFDPFTLEAGTEAVERALELHGDEKRFGELRERFMQKNYSWNASAKTYITLYESLVNRGRRLWSSQS